MIYSAVGSDKTRWLVPRGTLHRQVTDLSLAYTLRPIEDTVVIAIDMLSFRGVLIYGSRYRLASSRD